MSSYDDFGGSSSFTSGAADRSAAEQVSNFQASQTGGSDDGGDNNNASGSGVVRDAAGNVRNPYPNSFFSRVFGAENVSYQNIFDKNTLNNLGSMYEQRYMNPQAAVSRGFGKLFGGAGGEMTSAGPRVAGVRPQTLQEGVAGLLAGTIMPGAGMLEKAGRTLYAPEGMLPEGYEQEEDGLLESLLGGFGGLIQPEPATVGRAAGQLKDRAAELVDQARAGIRSILPETSADQMVDSVSRPMESRADIRSRMGGRASTIPTPQQDLQTMNVSQAAPQRADIAAMLAGMDNRASQAAPSGVDVAANISVQDFFQQNPELLSELMKESSFVASRVMDPSKSADYTIETETGEIFKPSPGDLGLNISLGTYPGLITEQKASPGVSMPELNDIFSGIGTKLKQAMGGPDFRSRYEQSTRNGYSIR